MNGKIYSMEAEGTIFPGAWEPNFDSQNGSVWSMDFSDNDHGMFNVSTEVEGVTIQLVYHTSDAGLSWSAAPDSISGLLLATLFTPDSDNAWIVGSAGQIYKGEPGTTSVPDHTSVDVAVTPNPFINSIRIESPESFSDVRIRVFNHAGQLMKTVELAELRDTFEMNDLGTMQPGVYFIHLNSLDGKLNTTRKLVRY
jgi:hypothetical protein